MKDPCFPLHASRAAFEAMPLKLFSKGGENMVYRIEVEVDVSSGKSINEITETVHSMIRNFFVVERSITLHVRELEEKTHGSSAKV